MSNKFKPGDIVVNRDGAVQLFVSNDVRIVLHSNPIRVALSALPPPSAPTAYKAIGNISELYKKIRELPHAKAILR